MEYIFAIIGIPLSIWVLMGSYKEKKKEYGVTNDREFIFGMIWLFMWLLMLVNGVTLLLFDSTVGFTLKSWG